MLVRKFIENGIPVTSVPGPSAVIAALTLSGFSPQPFTFAGFLPVSEAHRQKALARLKDLTGHTLVLFESPQRVLGLLREVGEVLGDREIALCREMTKLHEEVIRGRISDLIPSLASRKLQGEFTIVVAAGKESTAVVMSDEAIVSRFQQLQNEGMNRKEALKRLSKESGRSRNDLYRMLIG